MGVVAGERFPFDLTFLAAYTGIRTPIDDLVKSQSRTTNDNVPEDGNDDISEVVESSDMNINVLDTEVVSEGGDGIQV
jgi:hypothetical protein